MRTTLKIGLGILGGLAVGSGFGYYLAMTRRGRKAIAAAENVVSSARLPQPGYAMQIPYTEEDFQILEELVCECGAPVVEAATDEDTIANLESQIQLCIASELYPDFPWPPIPGDHPTAAQLFTEISVLVRKSLAVADICPRPTPPILDLPIPTP